MRRYERALAIQPLTITGEALRGSRARSCVGLRAALPDAEEHWRFTDLAGFDPDAFDAEPEPLRRGRRRCSTSTRLGRRSRRTELGVEIDRRARGVTFEPSTTTIRCSGRSSASRTSSRPRTRRSGSTACSSSCRGASSSSEPLYVRVANTADGRLAVLAPARRRRARRRLYADRGVRRRRRPSCPPTRTRRSSSSSSRRPSSSTSRSRTSRGRRGTSPRTERASIATPSSTGSTAGSARSSGKTRIENDLVGPGATVARDRDVLRRRARSTSTTTRSRSTPRRTRPRTSRSAACCATRRAPSGAA